MDDGVVSFRVITVGPMHYGRLTVGRARKWWLRRTPTPLERERWVADSQAMVRTVMDAWVASDQAARAEAQRWRSPIVGLSSLLLLAKSARDALELAVADIRDEVRERMYTGKLSRRMAQFQFQFLCAKEVASVLAPTILRIVEAVMRLSLHRQ
jgi:hypothetical protein